ncbi:hypothetical protein HDV00_008868 [Rhizophlyctis rosea]|nr:hypothetical protein HDV00_008868 [Rhizophlyctis rosea]
MVRYKPEEERALREWCLANLDLIRSERKKAFFRIEFTEGFDRSAEKLWRKWLAKRKDWLREAGIPDDEAKEDPIRAALERFLGSDIPVNVLSTFQGLIESISISTQETISHTTHSPLQFYTFLRKPLQNETLRMEALFQLLDTRLSAPEYTLPEADGCNTPRAERRVAIVGASLAGLFMAVEMCLMRRDKVVLVGFEDFDGIEEGLTVPAREINHLVEKYGVQYIDALFGEARHTHFTVHSVSIMLMKLGLLLGAQFLVDSDLTGIAEVDGSPYDLMTVQAHDGTESNFNINTISTLPSLPPSSLPLSAPLKSPTAPKTISQSLKILNAAGITFESIASYVTEDSTDFTVDVRKTHLAAHGIFIDPNLKSSSALLHHDNVNKEAINSLVEQIAKIYKISPERELLVRETEDGEEESVTLLDLSIGQMTFPAFSVLTKQFEDGTAKSIVVGFVGSALGTVDLIQESDWRRVFRDVRSVVRALRDLGVVEK